MTADFAGAASGLRSLTGRLLRRGYRCLAARAVLLVDIVDHQRLEFGRNRRAPQGAELLAVDEHGCGRRFAGAGQGDADIGVLGFAGAVDDAAHDRDVELLDAGILRLPARTQVFVIYGSFSNPHWFRWKLTLHSLLNGRF